VKIPEVKAEKVNADIVFISETPMIEGSETKKLWDELLTMAGIEEKIYLTSAVKSDDEKAPSFQDISAYRPFLKQEIDSIKPKFLVCLGGSAAQAVFGKLMKLRETQRKIFKTSFCEQTIVLSNPKTFLRTKDEQILSRLKNEFVQDLKHTLSTMTSSSQNSSQSTTSPAQS
jgi:DNA polymerase